MFAEDDAWVDVVGCVDEELGVSVVKFSADDCHSNWNDSIATVVDVSSYPKFKIVVNNTGDVMLDEVVVVDRLPVGIGFDYMLSSHDDPVFSDGGQVLTWTFYDVPVGWSEELVFTGVFDEGIVCDLYENTVNVTGSADGFCCDVFAEDDAWVDVVGCEPIPQEDGILSIEKWVKPDCNDLLTAKQISFDYGDYDYVTYRIDVKVNDSFDQWITNLSVRDNLPQIQGLIYNRSFIRDESNDPYENYIFSNNSNFLYWNFTESIAPGSLFSIYYCADVIGCGEFENLVNVTGKYFEDGPCCPDYVYANSSATVEVICGPGIEVKKEASLDGINWENNFVESFVDDTIWFRLTIENTGYETLQGVNIYDYLPDFLKFKQMIDDGDADVVNITCEDQIYDLRWFFTNIYSGESVEIIFTVDVTNIGHDENVVTVTSCGGPGDTDTVDVNITEGMHVDKRVSLDGETWLKNVSTSAGGAMFWNITVSFYSTNTSNILHHIEIWDRLPGELSYISNSAKILLNNGTTYSMNPTIHGELLFWDLDDELLENGDYLSVIFKTNIANDAVGEIENYVNVTGRVCDNTFHEANDSAVIFISGDTIEMDCEKLVREDTSDDWVDEVSVSVGDQIGFNITFTNTGNMPMYGISVFDKLPSNMDYVSGSAQLLFNGSIFDYEPDIYPDNILLWDDICNYLSDSNEEIADYLYPDEHFSIHFEVSITKHGNVTNIANVNGTMCFQGIDIDCSDSAAVNVQKDPLKADAGSGYSGYVDETIQLSGDANGGVAPYNYYWDLDDDGEFDDSTIQNPTKTWATAGTYSVSLKVIDDEGEEDTDSVTVSIQTRDANLYCTGSLSWSDIAPGSTLTDSIIVENIGDSGSKLDWSIESMPDWGEWTFSPSSGLDLTPEDGEQTIGISLQVPDKKNEDFSGSIILVNDEDSNDRCEITITLTTPYINNDSPFLSFLRNVISYFPFLDWLVDFFSF